MNRLYPLTVARSEKVNRLGTWLHTVTLLHHHGGVDFLSSDCMHIQERKTSNQYAKYATDKEDTAGIDF